MTARVPQESSIPPPTGASSLAREGLPDIDLQGLSRAIARLESDGRSDPSVLVVLRREARELATQAERLSAFAQHLNVELRQLRETRDDRDELQADNQRRLHEDNDQFVAQLLAEHEAALAALQRERDAAIERVRELSRGISRVGGVSSASLRRISTAPMAAPNPTYDERSAMQARIDELCEERERSLKLLRQLAEQRDRSEAKLVALAAGIGQESRFPNDSALSTDAVTSSALPHSALVEQAAKLREQTAAPLDLREDVDGGWDLAETAPSAAFSPHEPSDGPTESQSARNAGSNPSPGHALPLLRRRADDSVGGAGTYALSSTDNLPAEEVVLLRPDAPRSGRSSQ